MKENFMKNMRIGTRLGMGFAFVLMLMASITATGLWGLVRVGDISDQLTTKMGVEKNAFLWSTLVVRNGERAVAMALTTNTDDEAAYNRAMALTSEEITGILKKITEYPGLAATDRAALAEMERKRNFYIGIRNEIAALKATGTAEAREQARKAVYEKMIPARDDYSESIMVFANGIADHAEALGNEIARIDRQASLILITLSIISAFIGIVFAFMLTRGITRPLTQAVQVAQTVASGDLTSTIVVSSTDETGMLMTALREMNESLFRSISQVRRSAETIATAASEIAVGNQDLSSRTEEQASSLEETASSMEEITSTVRQNGDNARQANQLSASVAAVAHKGGESSSQVENMMDEINESSSKIVDIISVIDGIAFQTNILALNAAVEAARAGEQGRGFAVVATEVRNLAQRSAAAAREIKTLIDDSVGKVESGTRYVHEASENMREIVAGIERVNDIMTEISSATQEQVIGIEQVNQAITEMDTVSQQNAALVEQAAAASESMQDQARALVEVAAQFRLGNDGQRSSAGTPGARAVPKSVVAAARAAPAPVQPRQLVTPGGGSNASSADDDSWEEF